MGIASRTYDLAEVLVDLSRLPVVRIDSPPSSPFSGPPSVETLRAKLDAIRGTSAPPENPLAPIEQVGGTLAGAALTGFARANDMSETLLGLASFGLGIYATMTGQSFLASAACGALAPVIADYIEGSARRQPQAQAAPVASNVSQFPRMPAAQ